MMVLASGLPLGMSFRLLLFLAMLWNQLNHDYMSKYMTSLTDFVTFASPNPKQPILVFHIVIQSGLEHLRSEWLGTRTARPSLPTRLHQGCPPSGQYNDLVMKE